MPRPAIIIGVGGTGSWVLSWLKKDLLETYGRLDHIPVKLLLFDVADIVAEVGSSANNINSSSQQYSRFVVIEPEREFVQLPTDKSMTVTRNLDDAVRRNDPSVDHFSRWFCGGGYPAASLSLVDGAGKFRQLGRMSLVQGLHSNGTGDTAYAKLNTLINEILNMVRSESQPSIDVHIAGSFAGGTGSGIFMDIAWLIRSIIHQQGDHVKLFITGFFAMPSVFNQSPSREMRAKSFNSWRELNRMMTIDKNTNSFMLRWGKSAETVYPVDGPVYDHLYLVDSGPGGGVLTSKPQDAVFPIMAEAISFMLDDQSGEKYIQHIITNLNSQKARHPFRGKPTFSTLYVRSWKLPIFHTINVARHQFAIRFLEELLSVEEQEVSDNAGNLRKVYSLAPQPLCRARAVEPLLGQIPGIGTTAFIEEVGHVMNISNDQLQRSIHNYAEKSTDLLSLFAQMPQTPEAQDIINKLDSMLNLSVPTVHTTNNNEEVLSQLNNAESYLYGPHHVGGVYADVFGDFQANRVKGKLYDALEFAKKFHLLVFQQRVQEWIRRELNVSSAGSSGLACVSSAIKRLSVLLETTIHFFEEVQKAQPKIVDYGNDASYYINDAKQRISRANFIGKFLGSIRDAVGNWHQYEDDYLTLQRNRRAIERIVETVQAMHDFIENNVLRKITAIEQQLVTDNNYDRVTGLFRGVIESLDDEYQRHGFDKRLTTFTTLLADTSSVGDVNKEEIERLISRTKWEIDEGMNIRMSISVSDNLPPINLEANMKDPQQTRRLVIQLVEQVAERVVVSVDESVAMDLLDINNFSDELIKSKDTLFAQSSTTPPQEDIRTFYIRAYATQEQQQQLHKAIAKAGIPTGGRHETGVVGSANKHKIVVFSARELLLPENFNEWQSSLAAYQVEVRGDPNRNISADFKAVQCDHLFAGEKNALGIEYRHYQDGNDFPILNYRLVHLLEERQRLRDFLWLWVLDRFDKSETQRFGSGDYSHLWHITMPLSREPIYLCNYDKNDLLGMIETFVIKQNDLNGRALESEWVSNQMTDVIGEWYKDAQKSTALLERLRYERQVINNFSEVIHNQRRNHSRPDEFKAALFDLRSDLQEHENYWFSLAEAIASDFGRKLDQGDPLVSNVEAHEQMLNILLPKLFDELVTDWENRLERRR